MEPGLVRFEYRDYAFRGADAQRAAEASDCAADQGAYWRYHDTLFLNQQSPEGFSAPRLKRIAETLGLDTAAFNACLDGGEKRAEVEAEVAEGQAQGVDSTPTVFINGVEADWSNWDNLKQAIDAALEEAEPRRSKPARPARRHEQWNPWGRGPLGLGVDWPQALGFRHNIREPEGSRFARPRTNAGRSMLARMLGV